MSITSGLVDSHHEMELSPSTQRVTSNWVIRHILVLLLAAAGLAAILYAIA